jgi:DNA-binding protein H-NS
MTSSLKEINAQIESLQKQAAEIRDVEVAGAIASIKETMADYGITIDDLGLVSRKKITLKAPVAPKYRDPATGKTWSGRGKQPTWLAGKVRDTFLIS